MVWGTRARHPKSTPERNAPNITFTVISATGRSRTPTRQSRIQSEFAKTRVDDPRWNIKSSNISLEVSSILKIVKNDVFSTSQFRQHLSKCCSGGGMASIFVSCMMPKNKNGQIQLLLKAQILALKMCVRQTIGINMVWRTHIFSKIQVKMSRSKIWLSLGKNTDYWGIKQKPLDQWSKSTSSMSISSTLRHQKDDAWQEEIVLALRKYYTFL